jgi:cellulose synthase/poly-beta-1,6-N-acetylglucosamine synthase-like glycosyltransferase
VRSWHGRGVRVVTLPRPLGKAMALNQGVAAARGEVLVLTDARQPLLPGALGALVAALGDANVGAVSGEIALPVGAGPLGLYRRLDDQLRRWEAASGSAVGVTGCLWAMRRRHWTPLEPGAILDDLHQPLGIVRQGLRVVVEPEARALDVAAPAGGRELERRVRTLAGNLQLVRLAPWVLSPWHNPIALRLLSHKLLRLFAPLALATLLATTVLLVGSSPVFALALVGQAFIYGLAVVEPARVDRGALARLARFARAFVLLHLAAGLAWWALLRGRTGALWRDREDAPARCTRREGSLTPPAPTTAAAGGESMCARTKRDLR